MVVTAEDLAAQLKDFRPSLLNEKLTEERFRNHSHKVTYLYRAVEGAPSEVYLHCVASVEPTSADAKSAFLGLGTPHALAEERPDPDTAAAGDESKSVLLFVQGKLIGRHFVVRAGSRVLALTLTGASLDGPGFATLLQPKLAALKRLEP